MTSAEHKDGQIIIYFYKILSIAIHYKQQLFS